MQRNSSVTHSSRQRWPRSSQNPSNRRGNQVQVTTTRASGLRSRLSNQTPVRISRERNLFPTVFREGLNFQFPSGMDLEMVCFSLMFYPSFFHLIVVILLFFHSFLLFMLLLAEPLSEDGFESHGCPMMPPLNYLPSLQTTLQKSPSSATACHWHHM